MPTPQRSYNMSRIRGRDTKPEIIVRRFLWAHGFRYRLNHPRLPGKPDIVLRKYRTCIFVNGCFWHGHHVNLQFDNLPFTIEAGSLDNIENSECCKIPHTNREFWVKKIMRNKQRDIEVQRKLAEMGWHSIVIWECELKPKIKGQTLESIAFTLNKIYLNDRMIHKVMTYELPEMDSSDSTTERYGMAAEEIHNEYGKSQNTSTDSAQNICSEQLAQ